MSSRAVRDGEGVMGVRALAWLSHAGHAIPAVLLLSCVVLRGGGLLLKHMPNKRFCTVLYLYSV